MEVISAKSILPKYAWVSQSKIDSLEDLVFLETPELVLLWSLHGKL